MRMNIEELIVKHLQLRYSSIDMNRWGKYNIEIKYCGIKKKRMNNSE